MFFYTCLTVGLLQFCRSAVGGSACSQAHNGQDTSDLIFESRFESGNLAKVVKITSTYYELSLRSDMYTNRHTQWFYFRIENTKKNIKYRYESYILLILTQTNKYTHLPIVICRYISREDFFLLFYE